MSAIKELQEIIELYGDFQKELTIITPKENKHPFLLRIDFELPKIFIPRLPQSKADSENDTIPRVVTAQTLLGCIVGHAHFSLYVKDRYPGQEHQMNHLWISGFNFEVAVIPSKKLVFDAEESGEVWLLTYNKDTTFFKHHAVGELFITEVVIQARGDQKVHAELTRFCVGVEHPAGLWMTPKTFLKKGYYSVSLDTSVYAVGNQALKEHKLKRLTEDAEKALKIESIDEKTYREIRKLSVGQSLRR